MEFIASYWLALKLFSFIFYSSILYSAGQDGEGQSEINPFAKKVASIAQTCNETQISFARAQPSRQKRGVNSETQISFARAQRSRQKRGVDRSKL